MNTVVTTVECPACKGVDLTKGFRFVTRSHPNDGEPYCEQEPAPACSLCGGRGRINTETARRYGYGVAIARARVEAGLSLFSAAALFGIEARTLSAIEHGRTA